MKGFTIIELIIVIILISIISAIGIGLLSSTDQYTARLASDRWLAGFRLAQRLALQKQNSLELLELSVAETSDSWVFRIRQGSQNLSEFDLEKEPLEIRFSDSDFSASCSTLPILTFPFTSNFDGYGNSVSTTRTQVTQNKRLCFIAGGIEEICISPSGYAYEGTCQG